jgi:hypothetical protein
MPTWIILLHQIPPQPPYFRAKILRRLNQLGALGIKNSAYLLPASDEALEDFEWLVKEIREDGGDSWLFRCEGLNPGDEVLKEAFQKLRSAEYQALAREYRDLLSQGASGPQLRKLKRRKDEIGRIDFFEAPGREEVEMLMKETAAPTTGSSGEYKGRTWVTRQGVKVDRTASAWLIRRFIDPAAQFRFVDPRTYRHGEAELRFDMFEGEFTHQGELCTFEVLLRFFSLQDPALTAVGEVVHDIDLKDNRYQRPETAGIARLIDGIALRHTEDGRRIEEAAILFEALYAQYGEPSP